jgi:hypothetical protein
VSEFEIAPDTCLSRESLQSLLYYASRTEGSIVEVGVYRGGSAYHLARLGRPLFLFDTFEGMPQAGPLDKANPVGKFADTSAEEVQRLIPSATLVKGIFPDTLTAVDLPRVGFVHADADNYEVTRAILKRMPLYMPPGGLILIDDFMVDGCDGCTQAVVESGHRVLVATETGKALVIV